MQTQNEEKLLNPILDSALTIVGVLLLVLGISVLSRPVEAAGCGSTPLCPIWDVYQYGCDYGCPGCNSGTCCYYELGQCVEYPYAFANFKRCGLGECQPQ